MAAKVAVGCPRCGKRLEAPGPGSYRCPRCGSGVRLVRQERPKGKDLDVPVRLSGVIPWDQLPPEVKDVALEAKRDLDRGKGPGDLLGQFTGALGIKPCRGCKRRLQLVNRLGRRGLVGVSLVALLAGLGLWKAVELIG